MLWGYMIAKRTGNIRYVDERMDSRKHQKILEADLIVSQDTEGERGMASTTGQ